MGMEKAEGNVTRAAASLGVSRPTLCQMLARCGLKKTKSDHPQEKA
jgi:two-component system NtrC family response regulator